MVIARKEIKIQEGARVKGYILRVWFKDIDFDLMEKVNPNLARGYRRRIEKLKKRNIPLESIFCDYGGITSSTVQGRLAYHLENINEPFMYAKGKIEIIHEEDLGIYKKGETEKLERLLIEERTPFYKRRFEEENLFPLPFGPRVENGTQLTHPYPDHERDPFWYRESYLKEESPSLAAQNAIVDLN